MYGGGLQSSEYKSLSIQIWCHWFESRIQSMNNQIKVIIIGKNIKYQPWWYRNNFENWILHQFLCSSKDHLSFDHVTNLTLIDFLPSSGKSKLNVLEIIEDQIIGKG